LFKIAVSSNDQNDFLTNPRNYKFNALKKLKEDEKLELQKFISQDFNTLSDIQRERISKLVGIEMLE